MNIVLLRPGDWVSDCEVDLDDHRAHHLRQVLGVTAGDSVRVGIINGERGVGVVSDMTDTSIRLAVALTESPPARHRFDLVLALPRPKMLRRVLRTAAEFGVADIHLIHSYRVEKSYWQSPLLTTAKLESALIAGMERSGDTLMPSIQLHHRFRPFIEDVLPALVGERSCWLAHPGTGQKLAEQAGPGVVMIGPEGGFVPFELDLACANGAQPVALGSRVLSVDTAVNAALALGAD